VLVRHWGSEWVIRKGCGLAASLDLQWEKRLGNKMVIELAVSMDSQWVIRSGNKMVKLLMAIVSDWLLGRRLEEQKTL